MFLRLSGKQWYGAAVLAFALPTGWAFTRYVSSLRTREVVSAFHGVRLGMSAAEVRSRFDVPGRFDVRPAGEGVLALGFEASGSSPAGAAIPEVVFEFHEGLLVAVRVPRIAPTASPPPPGRTATSGAVRRVTRLPDGHFSYLLLARTCPAHADEVRTILAEP